MIHHHLCQALLLEELGTMNLMHRGVDPGGHERLCLSYRVLLPGPTNMNAFASSDLVESFQKLNIYTQRFSSLLSSASLHILFHSVLKIFLETSLLLETLTYWQSQ